MRSAVLVVALGLAAGEALAQATNQEPEFTPTRPLPTELRWRHHPPACLSLRLLYEYASAWEAGNDDHVHWLERKGLCIQTTAERLERQGGVIEYDAEFGWARVRLIDDGGEVWWTSLEAVRHLLPR
jgi:hypothetical protein